MLEIVASLLKFEKKIKMFKKCLFLPTEKFLNLQPLEKIHVAGVSVNHQTVNKFKHRMTGRDGTLISSYQSSEFWKSRVLSHLFHFKRSTSFPGSLSEKRETLVAAGHVPPRIWVVTKNWLKGGRLRLLLSILSLQESVKCCHQNKHFFHVAPVCCITVMSQCNIVQTPKKKFVRWTKFC